jgi:hypothetical protein
MLGSKWAREYYERQRKAGKAHNAAVRALAFKWIRILFRCWKNKVAYSELAYTQATAQKKPEPKINPLVEIKWEKKMGMSKFKGFAT